jgi:hypothetical protein
VLVCFVFQSVNLVLTDVPLFDTNEANEKTVDLSTTQGVFVFDLPAHGINAKLLLQAWQGTWLSVVTKEALIVSSTRAATDHRMLAVKRCPH